MKREMRILWVSGAAVSVAVLLWLGSIGFGSASAAEPAAPVNATRLDHADRDSGAFRLMRSAILKGD